MKHFKKLILRVLIASLIFSGCSNLEDSSEKSVQKYGSLVVNLKQSEDSRLMPVSEISSAVVTVSGCDMLPVEQNVSVSDGKGYFTIEQIPVGKNRIISVQALNNGVKIDGIVISALKDIVAGENVIETINAQTSVRAKVYKALFDSGVNISTLSSEQEASIDSAIPSIETWFIDSSKIASDYISGTLQDSSKYVLSPATLNINVKGSKDCTVQVTDPVSKASSQIASDNENITISDVVPGKWNIYVLDGSLKKFTKTVTVSSGAVLDVQIGEEQFDGIKILVEKSLGYPMIHYWKCSDTVNYPPTSWPGVALNSEESETDYVFNFKGVESVNVLITNSTGGKLCSSDIVLTEKGIYRVTQSGAEIQKEPEPPLVIVPSKAYLGNTFAVSVQSDIELTENTISINGSSRTVKIGRNVFTVSDFLTSPGTISVSGSVSNNAGTTPVSSSILIEEKPVTKLVSDPNELRIYQVMVASFQDGDSSIGYTQMWGPDNQLKGGDLQGIINAVPYIKELGCNAIWMTPIFESGTGNEKLDATGYFAMDYFNIDDQFGTMEKFDELVETCHNEGLAVILDGVFGHNKGTVTPSPNRAGIKNPGITPDTNNPVNYATNPNSIKYYSDVASYWITEHKIDGWRFDQCYQVSLGENAKGTTSDNCNTGGHNYWYDIRKVVEEAAASNGAKGVDWGTLGYMVGEHWRGDASLIQNGTVASGSSKGYGLNSCFDFPAYYQVVQAFAQEYNTPDKSTENITIGLSYLYKTYYEKGYSCKEDDGTYETYYPNFMLTNHDLFRIGDLIHQKYSEGFDSDNYAKRNMVLLAAQAAYSGPITIYYGDEIADHNATTTSGWGADNVARSTGKITGFSAREQKVHDWTQKCLYARANHEALWNGLNEQIIGEKDFYVAKKIGGGETIYIAFNYNSSSSKTFEIQGSGEDLLSGGTFTNSVTVPALSAMYVLVK
ncbi:MAG: alpha-amylase family glycosyl hydrolase [Spirochaetia bacterium]|nr:alpha-amylase family glycosyl hydrolase [Spirochaetia bacterium]